MVRIEKRINDPDKSDYLRAKLIEDVADPNTTMAPNSQQAQQQQQQLNQHQQNQLRMNMQQQQALQQQNAAQQQNAQQVSMGMQQQNAPNQAGLQLNVSGVNQSMATEIPQTVTASQASSAQAASVSTQMTCAQQATGAPVPGGLVNHAGQPMMNRDRTVIWNGMLDKSDYLRVKLTEDVEVRGTN